MKVILRFLKPHWKLCVLTILLAAIDVVGALIIPTYASDMLNLGTVAGTNFSLLLNTCVKMLIAATISGAAMVVGSFVCADLTSKIGADMRNALYQKSMTLSVADFRSFGTASVTTRTVSDITNIQMALGNCFQMLFPVPIIFVVSLILAFRIDSLMGLILLGVLTVISVICAFIMRSTAPMFRKLQKKLDRMSKVLLENITGVRVIRAFNKENHEEQRLNGEFRSYAKTAIKVNKRFAILDNISFFAVNMFVIIVYYLSGARITAGYFEIGDITAIIEYAMLALFYLMMAQMVILTLPRALECCNRIGEILDFLPTIADKTVARVFLCDPPVIILDEATSSVDTRTEMEISKAMKKLMKGRTSFVIAHRLSTIRDADTILFMENGNIIEQGNHKQLLEKKGAYAALYYSQFA